MIFTGRGILDRPAILDSLRDAPRWDHVDMCNRQLEARDVVFLAYAAIGNKVPIALMNPGSAASPLS